MGTVQYKYKYIHMKTNDDHPPIWLHSPLFDYGTSSDGNLQFKIGLKKKMHVYKML